MSHPHDKDDPKNSRVIDIEPDPNSDSIELANLRVEMTVGDWEMMVDAYTAAHNILAGQDEGGRIAMRLCAMKLWEAVAEAGVVLDNPRRFLAKKVFICSACAEREDDE